MKKGDFLISKGKVIYQIVGRWRKDIVLAATDDESDEVLVYSSSELEELIAEGYFRNHYNTGIKVTEEK